MTNTNNLIKNYDKFRKRNNNTFEYVQPINDDKQQADEICFYLEEGTKLTHWHENCNVELINRLSIQEGIQLHWNYNVFEI